MLAVVALASCNRYAYRPTECPPPEQPNVSAIAWEAVPRFARSDVPPGTIEGRVVVLKTLAPLAGARVLVLPANRAAQTDAEGRFRIDSLAPGEYAMRVLFIGYWPAAGSIRLTDGPGATVLGALAASYAILDGCG